MSPRTGRPPIENPKNYRITVRVDEETVDVLDSYCKKEHIDRAEGVRRGIKRLEPGTKK